MKRISKLLAAILAVTMCLFAFASCSGNKLKIATNAEFPPFESLENGEYVGFDIDLINAIAAELDMEVEFENMEFDAVLAAVTSGSSNVGLSGLTITEERKEAVDFTTPYHKVGQVLIVRADDDVFTGTTKEELDAQLVGKTVAACSGYTGQLYIEGEEPFAKIENLTAKIYDNPTTAAEDLKNEKVDAFILDDAVAENLVKEHTSLKVIDIALTVEEYAMAVKKGDTKLLEKLNSALKTLQESGKLDELKAKWELV